MKDEIISAFAFKTGKKIEEWLKEHTQNLQEKNNVLETKIMLWYSKTKDEEFAEYFGIEKVIFGEIK